jgi:hypothetical protein
MSSVNAPFGLRPAFHQSGTIRPTNGTVASGYASNIYMNSPVAITTDGTLILGAAGSRIQGAFQGVEYQLTATGPRVVSNMWPASLAATNIRAYFTKDPWITYEIQADGSLGLTNLGNQADWSTNTTSSGNTTTGLSSVALATGTITTSGSAGLRIVGLTPGPDNDWGDTYTIVQVQISEHQDVADQVAYA